VGRNFARAIAPTPRLHFLRRRRESGAARLVLEDTARPPSLQTSTLRTSRIPFYCRRTALERRRGLALGTYCLENVPAVPIPGGGPGSSFVYFAGIMGRQVQGGRARSCRCRKVGFEGALAFFRAAPFEVLARCAFAAAPRRERQCVELALITQRGPLAPAPLESIADLSSPRFPVFRLAVGLAGDGVAIVLADSDREQVRRPYGCGYSKRCCPMILLESRRDCRLRGEPFSSRRSPGADTRRGAASSEGVLRGRSRARSAPRTGAETEPRLMATTLRWH